MSKPIQTVEELDAVLHWRGKHAQAIRERDALQQSLTAADERADVLTTALNRIHERCEMFLGDYRGVPATSIGALRDIAAILRQHNPTAPAVCAWQYGAFSWHTGCGQEWMLSDGTPEQNGMKFCHSCGKTLVVEGEGDE